MGTTNLQTLASPAEDLFVELFCEAFGSRKPSIFLYGFGWELITPANMKDKFIKMVKTMDMSYSYKPVLLLSMFEHVDGEGRVRIIDLVDYFIDFYEERKSQGLPAEKKNSIFCKEGYSNKEVERNIFANPFKRFEDMRFMKRSKDLEYVEFNRYIYRKLTPEEKNWIVSHCRAKLNDYYQRKAFN